MIAFYFKYYINCYFVKVAAALSKSVVPVDSIENVKFYPSATVPVPSGFVSNLNNVPKSVVW